MVQTFFMTDVKVLQELPRAILDGAQYWRVLPEINSYYMDYYPGLLTATLLNRKQLLQDIYHITQSLGVNYATSVPYKEDTVLQLCQFERLPLRQTEYHNVKVQRLPYKRKIDFPNNLIPLLVGQRKFFCVCLHLMLPYLINSAVTIAAGNTGEYQADIARPVVEYQDLST